MEINEQINYYDNLWSKHKPLNSLQLRRAVKVLDYFIEIKRVLKTPRILDLGCGDGRFTSFIGEFSNADALELSEEAVKTAQRKYPHVNYFQGSALDFEFDKKKYDVIISQEVIEHIEDQEKYIDVCYNVLEEGGYLIITTPNKKVFDHMKGGNWSNQPIEKLLLPREYKQLVTKKFKILKFDSIIMNFGNLGYFKLLNHRIVIGVCKALRINLFRDFVYSKLGFGLHQCILAKKI
jgi:2-polyprenyl-3-methyl-5-hydroxy-6-metoxy-1,4-benzoquinol methylase